MENTSNLSASDSQVNVVSQNIDYTPPNFVSQRTKRRRNDDLEATLDSFKEEMKSMIQSMMATQQKELQKITPTLMEIKQTNCNIENSIAFLSAQNTELKNRLERLELQHKKDQEYITFLEEKMEDIQRTNRKTNLEIKNAPRLNKETKDDLINMAIQLSKTIDCEIKQSDIKDIYRVQGKKGTSNTNTPIIIETSSTILKTNFLKMCKNFNVKHKEKLCAKHLGLTKYEDTPVYVSEQLTARGARLYFVARDLAKTKSYKYCWTAYGRVYVRKTDDSPIVIIKNEGQVHTMMQAI